MASFYTVLFPRDVLDEIWDLIESVSEGIPSYSFICFMFDAVHCLTVLSFNFNTPVYLIQ